MTVNEKAGWVDHAGPSRTSTRVMNTQEAGAEAAQEVLRELNDLLDHASNERVEQHILDARNHITEQPPSDLTTALSEAETVLEDACQATQSEYLKHELRELRQALIGLVEGGHDGVMQ